MRRKTSGPQIASRRLNEVVLLAPVPEYVLVYFGTGSQTFLTRLELNCGINWMVLVPPENVRTILVVTEDLVMVAEGGGCGGLTVIIP